MTRKSNDSRLAEAVIAAMSVVSGTAMAQPVVLYGGGATLPAPAYVGQSDATQDSRLTAQDTDDPASLFYVFQSLDAIQVSYCQTGSGDGKDTLEGVAGFTADGGCGSFVPTVSPQGFGAPSPQLIPDFAAADSPLASSDYSNYATSTVSASRGTLVQFPSIAGSIAIAYNESPSFSLPAGVVNPTLSISQLCQVFSGGITQWSQIVTGATGSITVIYRSDGSGTTFNFSNFLTHQCGSSGVFTTSQTFKGGVLSSTNFPSNFEGQSGNPAVVMAISSTAGALGYAEYGDWVALLGNTNPPVFSIPDASGVAQVPSALAASQIATYTTGMVISSTEFGANGIPVLTAVSGDAQSQCLVLVDPNTFGSGITGYPIVAVTYLMSYYSSNPNHSQVTKLLQAPYNALARSGVSGLITPAKGYSLLGFTSLTSTIGGCVNE
jgi:phosphate transport system substrate-binding protein